MAEVDDALDEEMARREKVRKKVPGASTLAKEGGLPSPSPSPSTVNQSDVSVQRPQRKSFIDWLKETVGLGSSETPSDQSASDQAAALRRKKE